MDASLSIGLSALLTAQRNLDVTGQNIANQTTPNYSRQVVDQAAIPPSSAGRLQSGMGVAVTDIRAIRDTLVDRALLATDPAAGGADSRAKVLSQIENLFSTDPNSSLGQSIAAFFNSFSALASNPTVTAERAAVVQEAQTVAAGFNTTGQALQDSQQQLIPQIQATVSQVNTLTGEITDLNGRIRDTVVQKGNSNDLVDQRFTLLRQLAAIVPITVTDSTLGRVDVRSGGQLLVAGSQATTLSTQTTGGHVAVVVGGTTTVFSPASGQLGALVDLENNVIPGYRQRLDALAATLAREVNLAQSTGVGSAGGFTTLHSGLTASNPNLPLNQCGLPFQVAAGTLTVSVADTASGHVAQTSIAFDPNQDSLTTLADKLNAVGGIRASVGGGSLDVAAEAGHTFSFTNQVPTDPGSLGTSAVTLGGAVALDANDTYTFTADASQATTTSSISAAATLKDLSGGAEAFRLRVKLPDGSFATSSDLSLNADYTGSQTPDQLVADLNTAIAADAAVSGKVQAYVNGTQVEFRASAQGSASSVQVLDPTAGTTALGAGHVLSGFTAGQSHAADLTIGSTPNLQVLVRNAAGATVATLNVGQGYTPGQALDVQGGITAGFGAGTVTGTPADTLSVPLAANPDPQGLLAALGLNTLFRGSTAAALAVDPAVAADPSLVAAARSDAPSDNTNALRLADLQNTAFPSLGGATIGDGYSELLGQVGLDSQSATRTSASADLMLQTTENQRDAISAVSQDEEAVNLLKFQQAYQAAARYLTVIQKTIDLLMQV